MLSLFNCVRVVNRGVLSTERHQLKIWGWVSRHHFGSRNVHFSAFSGLSDVYTIDESSSKNNLENFS